MATKKLFVAIFLFLMVFCLLSAIFSDSGLLANRSLERLLSQLDREREEKLLALEALEERRSQMSSQASLDDLALSLGYNREGDVVYYFQEEDEIPSAMTSADNEEAVELYEGVPSWALALVSLGVTATVMLAWTLVNRHMMGPEGHERRERDKARREYEGYDW